VFRKEIPAPAGIERRTTMRKILGTLLAAFVLALIGPATARAMDLNVPPAAFRDDDDKDKDKKKHRRHHRHHKCHHHHRHHKKTNTNTNPQNPTTPGQNS
jgi:hypothetical protein